MGTIPAEHARRYNGIGHYPQLEAPAAVLAACRSFWTRIGALRDL